MRREIQVVNEKRIGVFSFVREAFILLILVKLRMFLKSPTYMCGVVEVKGFCSKTLGIFSLPR